MPWTAARTTECLRQCPLGIACAATSVLAIALPAAMQNSVRKTMSLSFFLPFLYVVAIAAFVLVASFFCFFVFLLLRLRYVHYQD